MGDATPGQPGDVKLVARWDNYWDTAPPAVITIIAVDADGAVSGLSAPYKHNIVSLTLNVTWK